VTKGVVVVAPTGNEGTVGVDIPAAYPHVVAVAGTDEANQRADFSNRGSGVDLAAPGADITTAAPTAICPSGYQFVNGTSFAAPAVAAAVALLLQKRPGLDSTQVVDMLRLRGLRAPAPGWSMDLGFGLLDVPAVLDAPIPPADQPEVDDTIPWAKRHPPVLTPRRRARQLAGRVSPHADPADVFRLTLKKHDRLRVTAKTSTAQVQLTLGDGKRTLGRGSALKATISRSGTYYVSVSPKGSPPEGIDYFLGFRRQPGRG
jgi:hypothetical protein